MLRLILVGAVLTTISSPLMAGETTCRIDSSGWKICDHHLKPGELGPLSTHTPPASERRATRYVEDDDSRDERTGPMFFENSGCVWNFGNGVYGKCQ